MMQVFCPMSNILMSNIPMQFDFGGWMPNFPSALRKPPPKHKGQTTEDIILETLPDMGTTVNTMAILKTLTGDSFDHVSL